MVALGWRITIYIFISFFLFIITSFTILGWILYGLFLLPFYGVVLLGWWIFAWKNRAKKAQTRYWIWSIVLVFQFATMLASPGNCYMFNQVSTCYSNYQILLSDVPRYGYSNAAHWQNVENSFIVFLMAYGAALVAALSRTKVKNPDNIKK